MSEDLQALLDSVKQALKENMRLQALAVKLQRENDRLRKKLSAKGGRK